jgi:outer membrane protein assembly factor BamA
MKSQFVGVALACWFTVSANAAPYEVSEKPPLRIGEVIIVGNTVTKDEVIRKTIALQPGQILCYPELRLAEINLMRLGIFEVDPARGVRPTVELLDGDGDYRDILVTVRETHTGGVHFKPGINANGDVVISLVIEERNFDPWCWPTQMSDLCEGRAFRGGGQKVSLELLQIPVSPCSFPGLAPLGQVLPMTGAGPLGAGLGTR